MNLRESDGFAQFERGQGRPALDPVIPPELRIQDVKSRVVSLNGMSSMPFSSSCCSLLQIQDIHIVEIIGLADIIKHGGSQPFRHFGKAHHVPALVEIFMGQV